LPCFFFDYQQRIISNFSFLFTSSGGEQKFQTSRTIDWGWYHYLFELSGGNIFQLDKAGEIPIEKALMFLMYKKDQAEQQIKSIKNNR
jgi:hypothetical protein